MVITGINVHVPTERDLVLARTMRMQCLRIDCNWHSIEPEDGKFSFNRIDDVVEDAQTHGFRVFATLAYSPKWQGGRTAVPSQAAWKRFVGTMVKRYAGRIEAYGMWNEPNLKNFWSGTITDYVETILKPGYDAVKKNDSKALVVGPDLATIGEVWPSWLEAMAANKDSLDVVSIHTYTRTAKDVEKEFNKGAWGFLQEFVPKFRPYRYFLDKIGKPAWLTEMGWPSSKYGLDGQRSRYSDFISKINIPVSRVYAYELRDDKAGPEAWGVFDASGNAKPAAKLLQGK